MSERSRAQLAADKYFSVEYEGKNKQGEDRFSSESLPKLQWNMNQRRTFVEAYWLGWNARAALTTAEDTYAKD